jgi:cytoskeletal protein CcmA (bactofilin family)
MSMWNKEASQTIAGQPAQAVSSAAPGPELQAAAAPAERPGSAAPGLSERPGGGTRHDTERRQVAWVGKSVVFKGELISSEDMTIDGRVEGIIEVREHTLTVGRDAKIHADIDAKMVVVLGQIKGTVKATDKIVLGEHAVVEGDLTAARVSVTDGAIVRGRVETTAKAAGKQKAKARETARELVAVAG